MSDRVANRPESYTLLPPEVLSTAGGASCLALLLTVADAFETGNLSAPHRFLLWQVVAMLICCQTLLLDTWFARITPERRIFRGLASAAAVAFTVLLMTVELHALKFTPLLPKRPDPLPEFLLFVATPVSAAAILTLLLARVRVSPARLVLREDHGPQRFRDRVLALVSGAAPGSEVRATFERSSSAEQWPDSQVLRVEAEDHYLKVTTKEGSHFIRGRMQDAVNRLRDANGLQIHRSHWVAAATIDRVVTRGRDRRAVLTDGTEIPVARSRTAELRRRGWIR